jgi:S-(hydroxymethyl)glutathione dehydrogenase/alcohol dehydrogenase
MRSALECCHKGWGESIIIGVAGAGEDLHPPLPARHRARVARLGLRRRARPLRAARLRRKAQRGEIPLDTFITHTMGLADINKAFDLMHEGKSIRTVIHYDM